MNSNTSSNATSIGNVRSIDMLAKVAEACMRGEEMIHTQQQQHHQQQHQQQHQQNDIVVISTTTVDPSSIITQAPIFTQTNTSLASTSTTSVPISAPPNTTSPSMTSSKYYTLKQIRKLSEKRLLSIFTERFQKTKNKNKVLSYKCQINPAGCQLKFESSNPVDESEVRRQVGEHLLSHIAEFEARMPPEAKIVSSKRIRPRKPKSVALPALIIKPESVDQLQSQPIDLTAPKQSAAPISLATTTMTPSVAPAPITTTISSTAPMSLAAAATQQPKLVQVTVQSFGDEKAVKQEFPAIPGPLSASQPVASKGQMIVTPSRQQSPSVSVNTTGRMIHLPSMISLGDVAPAGLQNPQNLESKTSVVGEERKNNNNKSFVSEQSSDSQQQQMDQKLALDYIDDIRKKSSSAAKAVIINGDRALIYQCKLCPDKQFTSTNGLIFHYKKHAGLKPYVCDLCSNTFTRQHSLNYHMLIHLNKSRFKCDECGRHFRHPSHFKEHMRRHTGETPFQCGDCLIKFKTRNTYKRHLHTKHSKILTSKGVIERASAPYQSPPKSLPSSNAATILATGGRGSAPSLSSSNSPLLAGQTTVVTSNPPTKPRRNYKIDKLRDNIERIHRYEEQQQQQSSTTTPPPATTVTTTTTTMLQQHQTHSNVAASVSYQQQQSTVLQQQQPVTIQSPIGQVIDLSNSHHHHQQQQHQQQQSSHQQPTTTTTLTATEAGQLLGPQAYPVAIYNLPSVPGMNTVHILDHQTAARIGKPFVDLTEPLYNQAQPLIAAANVMNSQQAGSVGGGSVAVVSITSAPSAIIDGEQISAGGDHHHHHQTGQQQQQQQAQNTGQQAQNIPQIHHLQMTAGDLKGSNVLLTAAANLSSTSTIPITNITQPIVLEHHHHHHLMAAHGQNLTMSHQQQQQQQQLGQNLTVSHHGQNILQQNTVQIQQQQPQPPQPPPQTTNNNENFMRLLEAIALTEDP